MVEILVIADDLTGALDTGVKFAVRGKKVNVITDPSVYFRNEYSDCRVLVIDAETRHLNEKDSYERVYSICRRALDLSIPFIYKKTDSALRGNIGSELTAVLDATKETILHFFPALPSMNRITRDGIHYIDDVPVSESVFGKDPYEPMKTSDVREIISKQSSTAVKTVSDGKLHFESETKQIIVYDAETDEELYKMAKELVKQGGAGPIIAAGCAAMAEQIAACTSVSGLVGASYEEETKLVTIHEDRLLAVSGSLNPITARQFEKAEKEGFPRIRLEAGLIAQKGYFTSEAGREKLLQMQKACREHRIVMIDTFENAEQETGEASDPNFKRKKISAGLGIVVSKLAQDNISALILVSGGDTFLEVMKHLGVTCMSPVSELFPGVVISKVMLSGREYHIVSKSGGFGDEDLLTDMLSKLEES